MLSLLRQDLFSSPESVLDDDGGRINQVMIRNRKSDVLDAHGKRIFHGVTSQIVECEPTPKEIAFFEALSEYFRRGYGTAEKLRAQGKNTAEASAVSFVMTTFRKLASSSRAAIRSAIERRRDALTDGENTLEAEESDERFKGEEEERDAARAALRRPKSGRGTAQKSAVEGELSQLKKLLTKLDELGEHDTKQATFSAWLKKLPASVKVLVFTEYRATQEALKELISSVHGDQSVGLIHGSMKLDERRAVVRSFNDDARPRFLISTEAGGEGLNMQRACSVLVNYDLPWNPIRLQQRIGRVYRYGQKQRVQVFNFKLYKAGSDAFVDGRVEELLRKKVREITDAFAKLQGAEAEDVEADVLGIVLANVNVERLYEEALVRGNEATAAMINKTSSALEAIRNDPHSTLGLFRNLKRFNLNDYLTVAARVTNAQLEFFLKQYLAELQLHGQVRTSQDGLLSFPVPAALRDHALRIANDDPTEARDPLGERVERATVSKDKAAECSPVRLLRFGDLAFDAMVTHVQSSDFSEGIASLALPAGELGWPAGTCGVSAIFDLRILRQTDKSAAILRSELVTIVGAVGQEPASSDQFLDLLLRAYPGQSEPNKDEAKRLYDSAHKLTEARLAALRLDVAAELGTTEGLVPVLDDYAFAWLEAV